MSHSQKQWWHLADCCREANDIGSRLQLCTCCQLCLHATSDPVGQARLLASCSPVSGDWLHALPISSVGLKMDKATVRMCTTSCQLVHISTRCLKRGGRSCFCCQRDYNSCQPTIVCFYCVTFLQHLGLCTCCDLRCALTVRCCRFMTQFFVSLCMHAQY